MDNSRRTSTRQRKPAHENEPAEKELAAASSDEEETAAVVEVALLARKKPSSAGKTRSARERAELAKTTRVLKSRLELALFKVGRGWEGVRFERIEAAHSQQCGSDTTSSSVDLGDDVLEASQPSSSVTSKNPSSASSSSRISASAHANATPAAGSTANWLERSAGQQEQLNSSLNGGNDDANQALLSPIKSSSAGATGIASTTTPSTRQARSASMTSAQAKHTQADDVFSPSAPKMSASASSSALPASAVLPTRPATTRPALTTSTSSLDCNPGSASARPRSDSNITTLSSSAGPMSAPPTTTTFSSPVASASNNDADEFATPATASRGSKRQRRESHQPRSNSKRQHATIQEEGSPPPPSASGSSASSSALNAAHLGHKRKISQNTLWHQSRAILSGIGGASASALSHASQPVPSSMSSNNAFSATHPGSQPYLNGQNAASLTSPVRLKPGQQKPHGTPQDGQHQPQMLSSPYGNMQQQSPQGFILTNQGSSVSPAGSSSGGTVRGAAVAQTPRRPSAQMMQNAPHTIASSHHSHHQYMPHQPSNLGLASSSGTNNINNSQLQQFDLSNATSGDMMQQLSQQGQMLLPQQNQQALYAFQSPQANQQPDYGYALYTQQPHIMQTPQHSQASQMMQHPHTAPQLHHSQQQQQPQAMLTLNGYATDFNGGNGMNVFSFGDPHAMGQSHLSPSYPQQQQMQNGYGNQMSPLNMSTGFRNHQQSQPGSTQMGQTMSMQGLPSQQPVQQHQNLTMMRSQSAISRAPSELSTFNGSQPPPLDPSLRNTNSSNGGSQGSSSVDTSFSHQSAQAAQIVAAQMAQQQAGTRPGTATGPERETAAELMLYLAASPSPQQPSKKVGNTALGGGDLSQVKGRKLFGNEDVSSQQQQQQQSMQQNQQQLAQHQQPHRNSVSNHSQASAGSGLSGEMSKSQSQMGMQQDHSNPFAVQHTYSGMNDQNNYAQQQMYSSNGSTDLQAAQLAQPFEYNQAMQFDPYTMMTAQGVTLDQEFGSGW